MARRAACSNRKTVHRRRRRVDGDEVELVDAPGNAGIESDGDPMVRTTDLIGSYHEGQWHYGKLAMLVLCHCDIGIMNKSENYPQNVT